MPYLSDITYNGTNYKLGSGLYGTCSTDAGTAAKVVTLSNFNQLVEGITIHVKFNNTNIAESPTLNVNSTGAKPIYRYGTTAAGTNRLTSWKEGSVISLTYTNNSWIMNDYQDFPINYDYLEFKGATFHVWRCGFIATSFINSTINSAITAWGNLAQLPEEYKPYGGAGVFMPNCAGPNGSVNHYLYITSSGVIQYSQALSSGYSLYGSGTWICRGPSV